MAEYKLIVERIVEHISTRADVGDHDNSTLSTQETLEQLNRRVSLLLRDGTTTPDARVVVDWFFRSASTQRPSIMNDSDATRASGP